MLDPTTKWLASHFKEISKKFAGKYIAIVNQEVVASGSTSTETMKRAQKIERNKHPILMKVPSKYLSI